MRCPLPVLLVVLFPIGLAAQEAVSSIDQARLLQPPPQHQVGVPAVDENGTALPASDDVPDDSFGAQMILKDQPRIPSFALSAGGSIYHTNNVALTRIDTKEDTFAVVNASGGWARQLNPELAMQVNLQASIFRYDRTSELDFSNLNAGIGVTWAPPHWRGVGLFARYDFTELINRHGNEILRDHQFAVGGQRIFVLGRAHAFSLGAIGTVGISTPHAAQRDQAGIVAGYHLQLSRNLATDVFYRLTGQFYNSGGRVDLNQTLSWNLIYRVTPWMEANAFFSFGDNNSNESVFDYDVISTGGGLGLSAHF